MMAGGCLVPLAMSFAVACPVARAPAEPATLVIVDRVINTGDEPLEAMDVWLALPADDPNQHIVAVQVTPRPDGVEASPHGQRLARWRGVRVAAGACFTARVVVDAVLHPSAAPVGHPLAEAERRVYLADGPKYQLGSEPVRAAAAGIAPGARGDQAKVGAIFDYVVDRLSYSRDATWDPAGVVLERGTGSCSEYVFVFIALCRAKGIPARYVGGPARRTGSTLHVDRVWHRWAEAYIGGIGWRPFDPTRSDGPERYRRHFGNPPSEVLALVRGDGSDAVPLGWRYDSYHEWDGDRPDIKAQRRGWWVPMPSNEVRRQVTALAVNMTVAGAREVGHPFVLPWLDELLYRRETRVDAARAMREIGGPAVAPALIDCLERAGDPAGDEAIAGLLREWTGEGQAGTRAEWDAWTRTAAFREFTASGRAGYER